MRKSIYEAPYFYEAPKKTISPVMKDLLNHIKAKVKRKYGEKFSGLWYVNQRDCDGGMYFIAKVEAKDIVENMSIRVYVDECIDYMTYGPVAGVKDFYRSFDPETGYAVTKGSTAKQWLHSGKIYTIFK